MDVPMLTLIVAILLFGTVATLAWLCYQTLNTLKETLAGLHRRSAQQLIPVEKKDDSRNDTATLRLQGL